MVDVRAYLRMLWRWRWLIALITLTSVISAALISYQLPKVYATTAVGLVSPKQLIPPSGGLTNQDFNQVPSIDQLVETYVGLINTDPVRQKLVKNGIPRSSSQLAGEILAARQPNSTLIGVTVKDSDPAVAQSIATEVIPAFNDSLAELQSKVGSEQSKLESLVPWELPSAPPSAPISPNIPRNVLLALGLGILVSVVVAFILERLDNTVKLETDVRTKLGLTLLGTVIERPVDKNEPATTPVELVAATQQPDPLAEQYRALRTNLMFGRLDDPFRTLVVTSTNPGEGKTTTATNLAAVFAQTGSRVILVDADFRKPALHRVFRVRSSVGLTNLLLRDVPESEAIRPTSIENLSVVACGPIPPNPSELLGSTAMQRVLQRFQELADLVILDTAPVAAVTDASVLGAICDGVIFVIERGAARVPSISWAADTMQSVGANVLGAVLNRAKPGETAYQYYYYGVDYEPTSDGQGPGGPDRRGTARPAPGTEAVPGGTSPEQQASAATPAPGPAATAPEAEAEAKAATR